MTRPSNAPAAPASTGVSQPVQMPPQHHQDQPQNGQRLFRDLAPAQRFQVFAGPTADEVGRQPAHGEDGADIGDGQKDARHDAGQEHVADRLLGHEGVDDQHR